MTDAEQLIAQARAIHAKAMNCSDLATEGMWTAHETVNGLPPNNYWAVMAKRTPTTKGVEPFTVWKAHVREPAMAGLLTFISTALPQLCDLAEKALASPLPLPEPGEGAWRPIVSAPRDGTSVLIWRGGWMCVGSARRAAGLPETFPGNHKYPADATHWRPLPSPPLSAQDTSARPDPPRETSKSNGKPEGGK